jgi:hypothetical protein
MGVRPNRSDAQGSGDHEVYLLEAGGRSHEGETGIGGRSKQRPYEDQMWCTGRAAVPV